MKKIVLMGLLSGLLGIGAAELTVNGQKIPLEEGNDTWEVKYMSNLVEKIDLPELRLVKQGIKKHPQHSHIAGYNGDITLKIVAPGNIREMEVQASVTNFADSQKRKGRLLYSLDGVDYEILDEKEFGRAELSGKVTLPDNRGLIWLRWQRLLDKDDSNGKHGFVLLTKFGFKAKGEYKKKANDCQVTAENPYDLKKAFPTGVFWPWERTKPNAEFAGMELWDFVDFTMKTLKEHHCDTLWFVNISPGDNARKILQLAEKHGLKAMINTHLLQYYYQRFGTFKEAEEYVAKTVNDIGDCSALLGYVLKDEPLLSSLAQCSFFYRLMKQADPKRDSAAIVMNRQSESFLMESDLPVICSDIYYFGHDKSTNIPNPAHISQREFTRAVDGLNKIAARYGKHSWLMPQMFGDVWGRHYRKGDKMIVEPGSYLHWRMPTLAETRWQIWEGVRLGSTGILFYVLYPPIPLWDTPDKVKPGTPEAKRLANMDKSAARAASWKRQELTDMQMEIDPGQGMVQPGGKPTPQMSEMSKCFAVLREKADLLAAKKRASFPVIFAGDVNTGVSTFENFASPTKRWGVVVNHDLKEKRDIKVMAAMNISRITNLNSGQEISLKKVDENFQSFQIELAAGDGALLEMEFVRNQPGMLLCREEFTQLSQHKVKFNKNNAQIIRFGAYGIEPNYAVKLTGDADAPVFSLENLTNPENAANTFAMNINMQKRQGIIYVMITGRGAIIKAVKATENGQETNVSHLSEKNLVNQGEAARKSSIIKENDFLIPAIVPVGTTALEFFLKDKNGNIEDLTLWYVEDN